MEGVYGRVDAIFENPESQKQFLEAYKSKVTSVTEPIPPKELLYHLLFGGKGRFHTNSITVRRSVFDKAGFFHTNLKLTQDSHMWAKLAATCQLYTGEISHPVAIRRVHAGNRILRSEEETAKYQRLLYKNLFEWSLNRKDLNFSYKNYFFIQFHSYYNLHKNSKMRLLLKMLPYNFTMVYFRFLFKSLHVEILSKKKSN